MKLKPVGHRLLVKPDNIEEIEAITKEHQALKSLNFEIAKPDGQMRREQQGTDTGVVVAIGPNAWKLPQYGWGEEFWEPWCKVGDRIVFGRYAGKLKEDPETKEEFMCINDDDVQMIVED